MDIVMNRMRRENRCFECGEHGHFARNCPKKKSRVAARAIVAELSDDLKELLRQELIAEMDTTPTTAEEVVHRVEDEPAEVPLETSEGCEEESSPLDFGTGQ